MLPDVFVGKNFIKIKEMGCYNELPEKLIWVYFSLKFLTNWKLFQRSFSFYFYY